MACVMSARCMKCVQTVPRASKKAVVQKESRFDPVRKGVETEKTETDEQSAYVAAWRVDKTLQLAADISNLCTYLFSIITIVTVHHSYSFHSRLKTHLFHKSLPPWTPAAPTGLPSRTLGLLNGFFCFSFIRVEVFVIHLSTIFTLICTTQLQHM